MRWDAIANLQARKMRYLPTFKLTFPGGVTNAYRIRNAHVEFQIGDGTWRILDDEHVQLHFILHTEVSKWLLKYKSEFNRETETMPAAAD